MKTSVWLLLLMGLMAPSLANAGGVCKNPIINAGYKIVCTSSAYGIMSRENVWRKIERLPFETLDHLDFNYPDDSTDTIYVYPKAVFSRGGRLLGYVEIFAIVNRESGSRVQFTVYYSLLGAMQSAIIKDLD